MVEGTTNYRAELLMATLAVLVAVGCGAPEPSRVKVAGQVRLDGTPLQAGEIQFVPVEGRPALASIEAEGRFSLFGNSAREGVVPGRYKVAVSTVQIVDDETVTWVTPQKYSNHLTSGIEVLIDQPTDSLIIDLSSKEDDVAEEQLEPVAKHEMEEIAK